MIKMAADRLMLGLNGLYNALMECSNIIRGGEWTSKQGKQLDSVLIKMRSWAIGLQQDHRLKPGARRMADDLKKIRERLDAGEYKTGDVFLRKLKSVLVFGSKEMIQNLKGTAEYEILINKFQKVA